MNDLRSVLKEGDPSSRDARMDPTDVSRLRARIVAAEPARPSTRRGVVGTLSLLLILAAAGAGWFVRDGRHVSDPARVSERRQLYFSAPGGTRIIWIFNSDLEVK